MALWRTLLWHQERISQTQRVGMAESWGDACGPPGPAGVTVDRSRPGALYLGSESRTWRKGPAWHPHPLLHLSPSTPPPGGWFSPAAPAPEQRPLLPCELPLGLWDPVVSCPPNGSPRLLGHGGHVSMGLATSNGPAGPPAASRPGRGLTWSLGFSLPSLCSPACKHRGRKRLVVARPSRALRVQR